MSPSALTYLNEFEMEHQELGKYKLEKIIGKGAMGVIYEAFDTILHRKVAIKTMTSELINDPNLRKRFYLEARSAGNLRHPNIITIHDMGEDGRTPYIVMELLTGTDLKTLMQQKQNWSFERIVQISTQAANGLHYAHQNGVVHRDIKPANIFLCIDDTVKILDFGVAHVLSSTMTQAGMLLGSLGYMAPEQISGAKVDGRADEYSLGVIMYELVSGVKPFMEKDITATIQAIMKTPPFPLRNVRDDCPVELERIILKSLEKEKEKRFSTLLDMARSLEDSFSSKHAHRANTIKSPTTTTYVTTSSRDSTPIPTKEPDTQQWLSLEELLSESKSLVQTGDLAGAFNLLKEHSKIYQKDPEFQTFFRQIRNEKEIFDKKTLFQKHYHEALKLLDEDNFKLARLELETLLKIDASSVLISRLEQQISKKEEAGHMNDWLEEGDKIVTTGKWEDLIKYFEEGEKKFAKCKDFTPKKEAFLVKAVDMLIAVAKKAPVPPHFDKSVSSIKLIVKKLSEDSPVTERFKILENQYVKKKELNQIHDWLSLGEELLLENKLDALRKHFSAGDSDFGTSKEYHACRKKLNNKMEKTEIESLLKQIEPLESKGQWEEAVDMLRPYLRNYPENRALVEKYNTLMMNKLEVERHESKRQFNQDQIKIVDSLIKSGQFEQAKKYLMVLLDKLPSTTEFEEKMIEIENHLDFERSITEIRHFIENEDYEKANDLFQLLSEAYPGEIQIEILRHELDNLRMTLDTRNLLENSQARLANAVDLAEKGAFDKALQIIQELMASNPENTMLYTNFLKIKTEKDTKEKEDLINGLGEINKLEKSGEYFFAMEKARILFENFPHESTLKNLQHAQKKKFVASQEENIHKALASGALEEAAALLETSLRLLPEESVFLALKDSIDMEQRKADFIQNELAKAHCAVKENRVDEALEIVNSLIPLNPKHPELKNFLKDLIYRKTRSL